MIIGVLVELSNKNIDKIFDYSVPKELESNIKIGIRVVVPFGYQTLEGFVLDIKNTTAVNRELKSIISIVDKDIVLNKELLDLGKKMQKMTLSTLISCYQVMLPKALKAKNGTLINKKYDTFYKLNKSKLKSNKLNNTQVKIIDLFTDKDLIKKEELINISSSSLKTLESKGILEKELKEHYRLEYSNKDILKNPLTKDQQAVVSKVLESTSYNTFLLHGVTGSGKTEVYMELIEDVIKNNKTAIVLVPEISLTPQMIHRFEERFSDSIAALHSALSEGEKYDEYRRIARGEAKVVIGARSAIFAPLTNLGIIVVDEEHSDSYKQDSTPRYNAIDVAIERAKTNECPVILGSATPLLESYARAQKGVYKLLTLPNRVNNKKLPEVTVVDLNKEFKNMQGHLGEILINKIKEKLDRNEQIILLLNRRGYSSFLTCTNCGEVVKCPHCDITLTYHKQSRTLRCHYCGYGEKLLNKCPSCGQESLKDLGVGTEKVEEELQSIFKDSKILRMDFDTTSKKGMHEKMITAFKNHDYDILLGTQIVAKGLDFLNVTLVGVINADTSLNIPDFRSSENTFSLLSQVAGRSGRADKEGCVIIQTFNPDHYAIKYVKEHNYLGFYNTEMLIRREMKYPPFYFLIYLRISSKDSNLAFTESKKIKSSLDRNLKQTIILGVSPCNIFKVNNIYRYSIILKYKHDDNIIPTLNKILDYYKSNNKIKIEIDFNSKHF